MLKRVLTIATPVVVVLAAALTPACGDADDSGVGTGGSAGKGGAGGSGGSAGKGGAGGSAGHDDASTDGDATQLDSGGDARDAGCGPTGALSVPTVPAGLESPSGSTLVARYHAEGAQIYKCTAVAAADGGADAATNYAWIFKAPSATLYDSDCKNAGTHLAGPTWESSDGSSVVGKAFASAPNTGSIPLLLLKAVSNSGEGIFANVSAVQRLDTQGGSAPSDGCTAATVDVEQRVPYTATYYFYTGGTFPSDAGADAADATGD